jgi:diamine N-acetyltransferase
VVSLREVTADTVRAVCRLEVGEHQRELVANNAVSIAQAHFEPKAWFRAVYAGDEPVGFAMLYEDPAKPEFWLWRFMIDHRHQGKGYGAEALRLVEDRLRSHPEARTARLGVVPKDHNAKAFYERLGWRDTGEVEDGELVLERDLRST